MSNLDRVCTFLKEAGTYYLATVDGDQPRVRPFGTAHVFEGKLYFQTGLVKDVAKQMAANPKVEICAFKDGVWVRVSGEAVLDERIEAQESMLEAYSSPLTLPLLLILIFYMVCLFLYRDILLVLILLLQ
jgi:uncharacterized pyridoxamine 5'-phosphate oxidase family protein